MRVMFATSHKSLPEDHGGLQQTRHKLALELIGRGHEVVSVSGLAGVGWVGQKAKLHLKILRNAWARDRVLGYPTYRSYAPIPGFARMLDQVAPDVVVITGGYLDRGLVNIAGAAGTSMVIDYHTSHIANLSNEQIACLSRIRFVANSRFTAALCPDRQPIVVRPIVFPNEYRVQNNTKEFITLINPSPHKGVEVAVAMAKRRPDLAFLFVRTEKYRTRIAADRGLPRNVAVVGPVEDMRRIYGRTGVVLAPSQWEETWGRIATEAQLSGIPVLASHQGGLPEAVGDGGLCVPARASVDRWLEALDMIIGTEENYRGFSAKALKYSRREEIDPVLIVKQFEQVLEDARHALR